MTAGLEKFMAAVKSLQTEMQIASGKNLKGETAGEPRFPGFVLPRFLRGQIREAEDLLRETKVNQAIERITATEQGLRGTETNYLRRVVMPRLDRELKELIGKVGQKNLDQAYSRIGQFEQKYMSGFIDLDAAAEEFRAISRELNKLQTGYERRIREAREAEVKRQLAREQEARLAHEAACRSAADQLAEMFGSCSA